MLDAVGNFETPTTSTALDENSVGFQEDEIEFTIDLKQYCKADLVTTKQKTWLSALERLEEDSAINFDEPHAADIAALAIGYGGKIRRPQYEESLTSSVHPLSDDTTSAVSYALSESTCGGVERHPGAMDLFRTPWAQDHGRRVGFEAKPLSRDVFSFPPQPRPPSGSRSWLEAPPFPPPCSPARMRKVVREPSRITSRIAKLAAFFRSPSPTSVISEE